MYLVSFFTLIFIIFLVLQNFADAGRALYRVARKYASKVKVQWLLLPRLTIKEKVYHSLYHIQYQHGNGTEWSPIQSVIIWVINKIRQPRSGSLVFNHEYYSPNWMRWSPVTKLIIITITISKKIHALFLSERAFE